MDKLSDGRRLSVKRGELWTKSLAGCESLQKKWLVFLRGWEDWCEIALISLKSGILAKELGFSFARMVFIPQSLRDSPRGHFVPTRDGPKVL